MKYKLIATGAEWTIEPMSKESWVLKKRKAEDWCAVGTYRSPNEAAAMVGARMTANVKLGDRHLNRLNFVLSNWDIVENG